MPKKIKFESFKNHFLIYANKYVMQNNDKYQGQKDFLLNIKFHYSGKDIIIKCPNNIEHKINVELMILYARGDLDKVSYKNIDDVKKKNKFFFEKIVKSVFEKSKSI